MYEFIKYSTFIYKMILKNRQLREEENFKLRAIEKH